MILLCKEFDRIILLFRQRPMHQNMISRRRPLRARWHVEQKRSEGDDLVRPVCKGDWYSRERTRFTGERFIDDPRLTVCESSRGYWSNRRRDMYSWRRDRALWCGHDERSGHLRSVNQRSPSWLSARALTDLEQVLTIQFSLRDGTNAADGQAILYARFPRKLLEEPPEGLDDARHSRFAQ